MAESSSSSSPTSDIAEPLSRSASWERELDSCGVPSPGWPYDEFEWRPRRNGKHVGGYNVRPFFVLDDDGRSRFGYYPRLPFAYFVSPPSPAVAAAIMSTGERLMNDDLTLMPDPALPAGSDAAESYVHAKTIAYCNLQGPLGAGGGMLHPGCAVRIDASTEDGWLVPTRYGNIISRSLDATSARERREYGCEMYHVRFTNGERLHVPYPHLQPLSQWHDAHEYAGEREHEPDLELNPRMRDRTPPPTPPAKTREQLLAERGELPDELFAWCSCHHGDGFCAMPVLCNGDVCDACMPRDTPRGCWCSCDLCDLGPRPHRSFTPGT